MKDIFSTDFTSLYSKKVIFDIVKDDKNKQKTDYDKILCDRVVGLQIDEWLKNTGCKAILTE